MILRVRLGNFLIVLNFKEINIAYKVLYYKHILFTFIKNKLMAAVI